MTRVLNNIDVVSAENGEEALKLLRDKKHEFLLIMLDLSMPTISGYEVLKIIKSDPELRDTPVVVLSANGAQESVQ
jgi:CheY-like chemotaxis protein